MTVVIPWLIWALSAALMGYTSHGPGCTIEHAMWCVDGSEVLVITSFDPPAAPAPAAPAAPAPAPAPTAPAPAPAPTAPAPTAPATLPALAMPDCADSLHLVDSGAIERCWNVAPDGTRAIVTGRSDSVADERRVIHLDVVPVAPPTTAGGGQ